MVRSPLGMCLVCLKIIMMGSALFEEVENCRHHQSEPIFGKGMRGSTFQ